jgi:glucan phosphorylase
VDDDRIARLGFARHLGNWTDWGQSRGLSQTETEIGEKTMNTHPSEFADLPQRLNGLGEVKLIDAIREQSRRRWMNERANPSIILAGGALLDPSVLTLGFARRFATYKRADLI